MKDRNCYARDDVGAALAVVCKSSAHYTADDGHHGFRVCSRHAIRHAAEGGVVTPDEGWPSIDTETPTT